MAANATQTIDQGMTKVNNAFTRYIGQTDESLGASQRLVDGLNALADNFDTVADTTLKVASILAGALVGRAIGGMVAALPAAVTGLQALVVALRGGALAGGLLTASLAPIGAIAGAAAAAIWLLRDSNTDAEKAADTHEASLRVLSSEIDNLDYANEAAIASTRAKIAADLDAASVALTRAKAERELAAAIIRDEINPAFSLLPAPAPSDVEGTVAGSPIVKDRQELIDTLAKQIEDLKAKSAEFESYASGDRPPPAVRPRSDPGLPPPPPPPPAGRRSRGGSGRDRADDFEREVEQITRRTEATRAATAAQEGLNPLLRDFGEAAAVAAARTDLLLAAQQAGLTITPELAARVETLATAYGSAEAAAARLDDRHRDMERSAEDWAALRQETTKGMIQDLMDGASAAEVFASALAKVGDRLLDLAVNNIFQPDGGGGGFWSNLVGAAVRHQGGMAAPGGLTRQVPAAAFIAAPRYHTGGVAGFRPGEIPAVLQKGEVVLPRLPSLATASPAAPGPTSITITVDVSGARGNAEIMEMVVSGVKAGLGAYDQALPTKVARISAAPRRR